MKKSIKRLSLFLVLVMILSIAIGCTPKEDPADPNAPGDVIDKEEPIDEVPDPEVKTVIIEATDKIDVQDLALLDSYIFDIDGDGVEETIAMYVDAHQEPNGEIYWDDGQNWLFLVEGEEKDYVLFNDYVQLGTVRFHVYTVDENQFYITAVKPTTAGLSITEYKFDNESNNFIAKTIYEATGNVNMLHNSYGY